MKRHNISFLLALIFVIIAFIAKYIDLNNNGFLKDRYWVFFLGAVVFTVLGSKERDEYQKKEREKLFKQNKEAGTASEKKEGDK